ncbi:MAG: ATP-binding protein, partial [Acidimicrobiia bacterium]
FCERGRAVDADFALSIDNAPAVARICRRLDGIPLAMELAAARIGVLSAEQVADRLDDCFRLLSVGPRTAAARQQTLRATMDWSYGLLSTAEQVLLQRLSVFAGSFDLRAAEGVAADGEVITARDVLDLLARLVDKSLVSVSGQGGGESHYRLLETVRQYAGEKLAEMGAQEESRRRHRDYFLGAARDYLNGDPFSDAMWLVRLPVDLAYENFRAALEWSWVQDDSEACQLLVVALGTYWVLGGYFVEGRTRMEQALAVIPNRSRARMRLLNMLGFLVVQQGEFDYSLKLHTAALALARDTGDTGESAVGAFFVGARVLHQGEPERAAELLGESSECFGAVGSTDGQAWCEMMLG